MKKLALLLAVMMLVLSVVGCGGTKAPASSAAPADPAAPAGEAKPAAPADGADGAPVSPETAWDGVQLTAIVGPDPDTIDPALNSSVDGGTEIKHIFEGLYTLDAKGVPVPGQAEKVDVSADGLTYTFTLRDGLKWSDGTPLTSEDFVYSWQRAIDPKTASAYAYMFECIDGYKDGKLNLTAPDAKTFVAKLIAPTTYFLELTAFPTYMPIQKATVEKNGEKWALSAETYIGNGPYVMKEWVEGSH
ncbi:MAG: ABC transporter substrate-binding protein, partial [Angelakisella sp.]